jgi:cytochrome c oxidase cbb3-type subunit I
MSQDPNYSRPPGRSPRNQSRPPRGEAQLRGPFLLCFGSAILWLLLASVLGLIASLKLHLPSFLNSECLTFGHVVAAQKNAFIYGWACNALFAVNLWLLAQLGRFELRNGWLATLGGFIWNAALGYGVLQIFAGNMNGFSLLEMPREVGPVLMVAFLLVGFWPIVAFARRPTGHSFASQWFVVGAAFIFPIVYALTQLLVLWSPASGPVQALAHSWFIQNLMLLWLGASGLAAVYYFIPKVLGRPLHGYYLATVAFWTYFLFAGATAPSALLGSPIPVWVQSVGVVASVLMIIPIIITAINFHGSLFQRGGWAQAWNSTTLRFVAFGAVSFTLAGLLNTVFSTRDFNAAVRFTEFAQGQEQLLTYAFLTMVIFGAAYFILPRLTGALWPSAKLIHLHFWTTALAVIGSVAVSLVHGYQAGHQLLNPAVTMAQVGSSSLALAGSVFAVLFLIGHLAFALNAFSMIFSSSAPTASEAQSD